MAKQSKSINKHQLAIVVVVALAAVIGVFIVLNQNDGNLTGEASRFGSANKLQIAQPASTCQDFGSYVEYGGRKYHDNSCDGNYLVTDYRCKDRMVQVYSRSLCQHGCSNGACNPAPAPQFREHTVFAQWSGPQGSAAITIDGVRYGPFYYAGNSVYQRISGSTTLLNVQNIREENSGTRRGHFLDLFISNFDSSFCGFPSGPLSGLGLVLTSPNSVLNITMSETLYDQLGGIGGSNSIFSNGLWSSTTPYGDLELITNNYDQATASATFTFTC